MGTEFYVNDAGNQADIFARSLEARYQQIDNPDYPFPEDGYPGEYVHDLARRLKEDHPSLLDLEWDERIAFCKRWGTDQMVEWRKLIWPIMMYNSMYGFEKGSACCGSFRRSD